MKNRLRLLALLTALLLTLGLFSGCGSDAAELLNSAASLAEQALDAAEAIENALPAQEALPESTDEPASPTEEIPEEAAPAIAKDGSYTTKEDLVLYIVTYGCLPENFITKKEAQALGWPGGSLEPYAPGCCIGGDRFGNYEGLLPKADGRTWTECDVDTLGAGSRGAKRLIFSNDGLIYYTDDHYESFTLEWGDPG